MFVASLWFSWWKAAHPSGPLRGGLELPGWVPLADSPGPGLALLRSPGIPLLTPVSANPLMLRVLGVLASSLAHH